MLLLLYVRKALRVTVPAQLKKKLKLKKIVKQILFRVHELVLFQPLHKCLSSVYKTLSSFSCGCSPFKKNYMSETAETSECVTPAVTIFL